ncbi:MAG: RagB/SusD family nutrient uptake outer membrane protein [Prolixibacteraceae bacterium]|jgi:starch-binding outer membrane protein, SusD/RagB family
MKKYFNRLSGLILISLFISSCSFLAVDDREMLTENIVLNKIDDTAAMWATLYSNLPLGFTSIAGTAMLASACDEADHNAPFNAVQSFNNGSWSAYSNPDNVWSNMYAAIHNANNFLKVSDTITYNQYKIVDPTYYNTITTDMKYYRLDARFFKAFFHYELWKRYGEIPIVNKTMTLEESYALTRQKSDAIRTYILGELDAIIPDLKVTWESAYMGRITKGAAMALKCRVLLFAASPVNNGGQYNAAFCEQAAGVARDLMALNVYNLNVDYRNLFLNTTATNTEIILDYRNANSNNMEKWNYPSGGNRLYAFGVGANATCPSQNLIDSYEMSNGKLISDATSGYNPQNPYVNRDPRLAMTVLTNNTLWNDSTVKAFVGGTDGIGKNNATTTGYYLKKFVQEKINLTTNQTASHVWHIFRYGEILLNYAEALNEAFGPDVIPPGYTISARTALNQIRARTGVAMPAIPTGLSQVDFREKVRNERRIELAFEGHRFWDVRRWMIAAQTENDPLRGMRITKTGTNAFSYEVVKIEDRKFTAPTMYWYPVPFSDLVKYKGWVQTPGW